MDPGDRNLSINAGVRSPPNDNTTVQTEPLQTQLDLVDLAR